jgi:Cu+-exporting ATPase
MNFSKSILTIALTSITLFGCKDKVTNATSEKETTSTKKEIAAAVKPETASFKIDGMSCAIGCAKTIEKELADMNGVQNAKVDFDTKQATVNFDADKISSADLIKKVEATADGKTYKVSEVKTTDKKA